MHRKKILIDEKKNCDEKKSKRHWNKLVRSLNYLSLTILKHLLSKRQAIEIAIYPFVHCALVNSRMFSILGDGLRDFRCVFLER